MNRKQLLKRRNHLKPRLNSQLKSKSHHKKRITTLNLQRMLRTKFKITMKTSLLKMNSHLSMQRQTVKLLKSLPTNLQHNNNNNKNNNPLSNRKRKKKNPFE